MTAKANLDKEQILSLAKDGWMITEIAGHFRVAVSTVYMYVTAQELQMARAAGEGELRAKYHKRGDTSDRVLIHQVETRLGLVPQPKKLLAEVSDQELAEELRRRMAASKMVKAIASEPDTKEIGSSTSEATSEDTDEDGSE